MTDSLMRTLGIEHYHVDHIYKGPSGQRTLTDMCIVTLNSNNHREDALKQAERNPAALKTGTSELKVDRAKPQAQLQRNNALRKASDILKKSVETSSKVEIVWKKEGSKDREIHVNGAAAFRQASDEAQGVFLQPFDHLHF